MTSANLRTTFLPSAHRLAASFFSKKSEQVDVIFIGDVEIDDSGAAAGSFALGSHANFPNASTTHLEGSFLRRSGEHVLEIGVIFIRNQCVDSLSELDGLNENHPSKGVTESRIYQA